MKDNPSDKPEDKSSNDQASEENNSMEAEPRRRIQDGIKPKNPTGKMNLDRRYANSERRCNKDSDHKGRTADIQLIDEWQPKIGENLTEDESLEVRSRVKWSDPLLSHIIDNKMY